jgi:hypothetical protein
MKAVQNQLDKFYESPNKQNVGNVVGQGATRGFFPIGAETGDKKNVENKESFSFGHDSIPKAFNDSCNLVADNIFPKELSKPKF